MSWGVANVYLVLLLSITVMSFVCFHQVTGSLHHGALQEAPARLPRLTLGQRRLLFRPRLPPGDTRARGRQQPEGESGPEEGS